MAGRFTPRRPGTRRVERWLGAQHRQRRLPTLRPGTGGRREPVQPLVGTQARVVGELLPGDVRGRPRATGSGVQVGGQLSQPRIRAVGERRLAALQPAERVLDPAFLGQRMGGTPELVRRGQVMADHLDQRIHTAQGGQRFLQVGRPEPIPVVALVLPWCQAAQLRPPLVDHLLRIG